MLTINAHHYKPGDILIHDTGVFSLGLASSRRPESRDSLNLFLTRQEAEALYDTLGAILANWGSLEEGDRINSGATPQAVAEFLAAKAEKED